MLRFIVSALNVIGFLDVVCLLVTGNVWHLASACAVFALAGLLRDVEARGPEALAKQYTEDAR